MIEVQNLTKRYGRFTAVDGVTFRVEKGEILGFLGPNGAGKTTTMRILTGYMPATSGKALVGGFDVFDQPLEAKRRTGYLPETPPLYPEMTVREYLLFVARGLKTAALARDSFSKLLATGLSFVVAMQVFVIVGGVTRVIPLTGVTLPFVSYGGSSIVANFVLLALLLLISNRARQAA